MSRSILALLLIVSLAGSAEPRELSSFLAFDAFVEAEMKACMKADESKNALLSQKVRQDAMKRIKDTCLSKQIRWQLSVKEVTKTHVILHGAAHAVNVHGDPPSDSPFGKRQVDLAVGKHIDLDKAIKLKRGDKVTISGKIAGVSYSGQNQDFPIAVRVEIQAAQ